MDNEFDKVENMLRKVKEKTAESKEKFGFQKNNNPFQWVSLLTEEAGELSEAVNETFCNYKKNPQKGGYDNIIKEACDVANIAVQIMEWAEYWKMEETAEEEVFERWCEIHEECDG